MATAGTAERGILAIWHDIEPNHVGDVLTWYDAEHHFERLDIPGFLNVRRYHALKATPQLFIRYETTDANVLASPLYLERLNHPTLGTQQAQPHFRNNSRTVCARVVWSGRAEGGFVVTARQDEAGAAAAGAMWPCLVADLLGSAEAGRGTPGIVGAELWRAQTGASTIASAEKRLRGAADAHVGGVVVVHATGSAAAEAAADRLRQALSDAEPASIGIYALAFAAYNPS
ncbi:hypothetical protein V5F59_24350 [Xanthobacter autotrophicus DSM 431]|uniref:hypothetical protein n=1 Tax=Xanthobacter nonsaccharivorans TaxID=3119912 RepID=UPI00372C8041